MRIGMIAPIEMRVPPVAYGGTELVVSLLTEELVRRGHEVTLFASGDSLTAAKLISVYPHFLRGSNKNREILNMLNVLACMERADEFDIIHNHTALEGMSLAGLIKTPVLTTLHGNVEDEWQLLFAHYKGWYNTISHSAKSLLPEKERFAGIVYNAIDVKSYPFNSNRSKNYMLFLSRLSHEKGPHLAIKVAKKAGLKLIIAGNVDTIDDDYFHKEILPEINWDMIEYVGEVDFKTKIKLMSGAYCLLAPITWPEPFGLFMAEAMACGTPVIALNRGSAPEVILDGKTGYLVNDWMEAAEAVGKIPEIDRTACREHIQQRFDVPCMTEGYLKAYEHIIEASRMPAAQEIKS